MTWLISLCKVKCEANILKNRLKMFYKKTTILNGIFCGKKIKVGKLFFPHKILEFVVFKK